LMQEARRAVGRTPPRPRREEERARAMTLDRAPTAEIAIFRRRRCDGRAERGEDYGEREVWGLAADGDLLGFGPRVVGPQLVALGGPEQPRPQSPRRFVVSSTPSPTTAGRPGVAARPSLPIRRLSASEASSSPPGENS
jgi:hypothetical protein